MLVQGSPAAVKQSIPSHLMLTSKPCLHLELIFGLHIGGYGYQGYPQGGMGGRMGGMGMGGMGGRPGISPMGAGLLGGGAGLLGGMLIGDAIADDGGGCGGCGGE